MASGLRMEEPRGKNLRKDASSFQEGVGGSNELHFSGQERGTVDIWAERAGNMGWGEIQVECLEL